MFKDTRDRPTLIIVDSHIGYGAPTKQDTHAAHGEPLGEEEIRLTKRFYGWPEDAKFLVPDGVLRALRERHRASAASELRDGLDRAVRATTRGSTPTWPTSSTGCSTASCPTAGTRTCPTFPADAKGMAGRDASGKVLNALAKNVPWLIGGSADLAPSTKTRLTFEGAGRLRAPSNYGGRNFHFGIREHAMGAVAQRHGAVEGPRRSARAS